MKGEQPCPDEASPYSSRLHFQNQDTHKNIRIYKHTGKAFNIAEVFN
jgi:hypothetical protein